MTGIDKLAELADNGTPFGRAKQHFIDVVEGHPATWQNQILMRMLEDVYHIAENPGTGRMVGKRVDYDGNISQAYGEIDPDTVDGIRILLLSATEKIAKGRKIGRFTRVNQRMRQLRRIEA